MEADTSANISQEISQDFAKAITPLNDNKVITTKSLQLSSPRHDELANKNCCSRCFRGINSFIWQNESSLMKTDHLKAAPCVSTKFLAILRLSISIALVIQTIFTIVETSNSETSFQFISQWNLILITILFTTMAIIEIKHTRRLNTFAVNVAPLQRASFISDGPQQNGMNTFNDEHTGEEEASFEQPWLFWKWLIPLYAGCLVLSVVLTFSYWMTEATSSEFLLFIGSSDILVWDLLPTLPTIFMLIEFPFNMIPIDWPMLVFVELQFLLFMLFNFIMVSFEEGHQNIYSAFDWYHDAGLAFAYTLACMGLLALVFAAFWAISQKWKLPTFAARMEHRYTDLSSFSQTSPRARTMEDDEKLLDEQQPHGSIQRGLTNAESFQSQTSGVSTGSSSFKPRQLGGKRQATKRDADPHKSFERNDYRSNTYDEI